MDSISGTWWGNSPTTILGNERWKARGEEIWGLMCAIANGLFRAVERDRCRAKEKRGPDVSEIWNELSCSFRRSRFFCLCGCQKEGIFLETQSYKLKQGPPPLMTQPEAYRNAADLDSFKLARWSCIYSPSSFSVLYYSRRILKVALENASS